MAGENGSLLLQATSKVASAPSYGAIGMLRPDNIKLVDIIYVFLSFNFSVRRPRVDLAPAARRKLRRPQTACQTQISPRPMRRRRACPWSSPETARHGPRWHQRLVVRRPSQAYDQPDGRSVCLAIRPCLVSASRQRHRGGPSGCMGRATWYTRTRSCPLSPRRGRNSSRWPSSWSCPPAKCRLRCSAAFSSASFSAHRGR